MKKKHILFFVGLILIISINVTVSAGPVGNVSTKPTDAVEKTAAADVFRLEGSADEFVLLDSTEEGFFVSTKNFMGLREYDIDNTGKYDIYDSNNVAYWLNNDFLENGNTYNGGSFSLPDGIKEHLIEREWLCEAGHISTDYTEDYYVKAKVALMSITEWKKYYNKLGYKDDTTSNYYLIRSVNGLSNPGGNSGIMVIAVQKGHSSNGKSYSKYGIRPVFYLDKNFFIEEKCDITVLGDNVVKIIREVYQRDELENIYNKNEIERIYRELLPQAKLVNVKGIPQSGKVLTASYTYTSPQGDMEMNSEYRWLRSKKASGPFSIIYGENELEYKIRPEDAGYYILFEVIPKSDKKIGLAVRSALMKSTVVSGEAPYAENVHIDGKAVVGEKLIARYNYADVNDDAESGTVIKWQHSSDGENFCDIENAEGLNWYIDKKYENQYIRCVVEVRNEEDNGAGTPVEADKIGPVKLQPVPTTAVIAEYNGVVKIITPLSEYDLISWEAAGDDGEYTLVQLGKNEYTPRHGEKSIRVRTIPLSIDGFYGKTALSNEVVLSCTVLSESTSENKSITVSGKGVLELKPVNNNYAYAISVKLVCDGTQIESIDAEDYSVFWRKTEYGVVCTLTKMGISGAAIPEKLMTINTSGDGTVLIDSAEGIYKTINGKYVKSEIKLSLEKR